MAWGPIFNNGTLKFSRHQNARNNIPDRFEPTLVHFRKHIKPRCSCFPEFPSVANEHDNLWFCPQLSQVTFDLCLLSSEWGSANVFNQNETHAWTHSNHQILVELSKILNAIEAILMSFKQKDCKSYTFSCLRHCFKDSRIFPPGKLSSSRVSDNFATLKVPMHILRGGSS